MPTKSNKERQRTLNKIRRLIGKNYTDVEIMRKMDLRSQHLQHYKKRIFDADKRGFQNLDTSGVFADYIMKNHQMVRELDELRKKFLHHGQYNALVAAIKQKREIYNDVIKKGQDFGFIERKADELKVTSEMTFTEMSTDDVKKEIAEEVKKMKALATRKIDMRPELLDVTPDEVKQFAPIEVLRLPEPDKKSKSKIKRKVKLVMRRRS